MRGAACSDKPGIITWHPAVAPQLWASENERLSVNYFSVRAFDFIVPVLSQQSCFLKQQAALFSKKTHKKTVLSAQETAGWQKYLQICCRFVFHRSCWINQRYTKCRLLGGLKHDSKWMLHCPLSAECVLGNCLLTHWSCQCSSTAVL